MKLRLITELAGCPPKVMPGRQVAKPDRTCDRKVRYPSKELAHQDLMRLYPKVSQGYGKWTPGDLQRIRAYQCPHCSFWHLGKVAVSG